MRLHYNKTNGIFSVRREDRSTVSASERRSKYGKLPLLGSTVSLGGSVHLIITRGLYEAAQTKSRPFVPAVFTRWPTLRLIVARIKEVF